MPERVRANILTAIGIIEDLPLVLGDERARRQLSFRQVSQESGIGASHLHAIENGTKCPGQKVMLDLLNWAVQSHELPTVERLPAVDR